MLRTWQGLEKAVNAYVLRLRTLVNLQRPIISQELIDQIFYNIEGSSRSALPRSPTPYGLARGA